MKYQNTKTGFIFESDSEIAGKDWVKLSPPVSAKEDPIKEPPKKTAKSRTKEKK